MNTYAEKLLRGIPNKKEFVDDDGRVKQALFRFSDKPRDVDGFYDLSINWFDCEEALSILMNQKRDSGDEFQFKAGAAIIQRDYLDELIRKPNSSGELFYERRKIPGNDYHGNIICKTNSKERQSLFRANLAMCVVDIVERP
jgi:hypothetical protein